MHGGFFSHFWENLPSTDRTIANFEACLRQANGETSRFIRAGFEPEKRRAARQALKIIRLLQRGEVSEAIRGGSLCFNFSSSISASELQSLAYDKLCKTSDAVISTELDRAARNGASAEIDRQ